MLVPYLCEYNVNFFPRNLCLQNAPRVIFGSNKRGAFFLAFISSNTSALDTRLVILCLEREPRTCYPAFGFLPPRTRCSWCTLWQLRRRLLLITPLALPVVVPLPSGPARRRFGHFLPVGAGLVQDKAGERAREAGAPHDKFKASCSWVQKFMRRAGFSLCQRMSIYQKHLAKCEEKLVKSRCYVFKMRREHKYPIGCMANASKKNLFGHSGWVRGTKEIRICRGQLPFYCCVHLRYFTLYVQYILFSFL